ncbi:MAG: N-acetyltransferase [Sphingobacteriales bacterium]|nr:MAG: N-acetyltransferase [Sphingobacteriales bacterium]
MRTEFENIILYNNEDENRFEMSFENTTSFIEYKIEGNVISLLHTEVDASLEGRGAGTAIVEKTLKHIDAAGMQLLPLCPFVAAYIKRHPGWGKIVVAR